MGNPPRNDELTSTTQFRRAQFEFLIRGSLIGSMQRSVSIVILPRACRLAARQENDEHDGANHHREAAAAQHQKHQDLWPAKSEKSCDHKVTPGEKRSTALAFLERAPKNKSAF
jgi:hypothetical protein